ncbi:MAG TPA: hypothetical protein VKU01_09930 [Bryobacteraceae bacterium]|nr:hypothetical protein [Bryobacteraceae bacterium]
MSATYVVDTDVRQYSVTDDRASVYVVLVAGALWDATANLALKVAFDVTTDRPDVAARAASGGFFVAAGFPEAITLPTTITLTFSAPGYESATLAVALPADAVFPVNAGTLALSRTPVRLQGRVVRLDTRAPIDAAVVNITAPNVVALRTPVHFSHAAGVMIQQRQLDLWGAATQLTSAARGGTSAIQVADTSGLAANSVLSLGPAIAGEYVVVAGLGPGPGQVLLNAPLYRSFAAGTVVQPVAAGAVGANAALAGSAKPGDGLLLLNSALAADTLEIVDGSATEYALTGALTDASGFYRFDGFGGVVSLDLDVSAAGYADQLKTYSLDFDQPVNVVDFRLA